MYYLYTLKSNAISTVPKFFVGKTPSICSTFNKHNTDLCEFSTKFAPWSIIDLRESTRFTHFELVNRVLYKMKLHGVENVRGGPWTATELCPVEVKILQDIIKSDKIKETLF